MGAVLDFLRGRGNKLLRDMLAASAIVLVAAIVAAGALRAGADSIRSALQPLPSRLEMAKSGEGRIVTVTRSVLDEALFTGSTGGRPIVLDPCTGGEKR
jgi:hypothetical protein